jgi:hypothetical protein
MKKALLLLAVVVVASLLVSWRRRGEALDPVLLRKAKQEYRVNRSRLHNKRYVTLIDYRKSILEDRLYVFDLEKQEVVLTSRVSHAFKSGMLYPTAFSNVVGSEQSCYGSFLTGETYQGKFGYSLRIDGLSRTNSNSRVRAVIFHPGYTWSAGCYMTEPAVNNRLINLITGKSLVVVYN